MVCSEKYSRRKALANITKISLKRIKVGLQYIHSSWLRYYFHDFTVLYACSYYNLHCSLAGPTSLVSDNAWLGDQFLHLLPESQSKRGYNKCLRKKHICRIPLHWPITTTLLNVSSYKHVCLWKDFQDIKLMILIFLRLKKLLNFMNFDLVHWYSVGIIIYCFQGNCGGG